MSLKHRITKLEAPKGRPVLDVATLQTRGAAVARGDIQPMTAAELTTLWQSLFHRPPHRLALEVTEERHAEWMQTFRAQEVRA